MPSSGARRHESRGGLINAQFVRLDGAPSEAHVLLQQVDHPGRVHFDIESDEIEAEVECLQSLGAKVVERMEKWLIMEGP